MRDLLGHVAGTRDSRDSFYVRVGSHPHATVTPRQAIAATPRAGPRTHEAVYSNTGFSSRG